MEKKDWRTVLVRGSSCVPTQGLRGTRGSVLQRKMFSNNNDSNDNKIKFRKLQVRLQRDVGIPVQTPSYRGAPDRT